MFNKFWGRKSYFALFKMMHIPVNKVAPNELRGNPGHGREDKEQLAE